LPYKSPEARKAYAKRHREENRERYVEAGRRFRARHPDESRTYQREYQRAYYHEKVKGNPRAAQAARTRAIAWYRKNAAQAKTRIAGYRRNGLIVPRQTPRWANRFFISEIYRLAKLRTKLLGIPHEVDHVVPLRGKNVCGLHVEQNLRVVQKVTNRAKGASFQIS
jgi:hypothetical protein